MGISGKRRRGRMSRERLRACKISDFMMDHGFHNSADLFINIVNK